MGRAKLVFEQMYSLAEDYLKEELSDALKKLNISESDVTAYKPRNDDEIKLLKKIKINQKILG